MMPKALTKDILSATVIERETKPHSARKSNREMGGEETWLSQPRGGSGLFASGTFTLKRRRRQVLVFLPPHASSVWEEISRARVKESRSVEGEWNPCMCYFSN